MSSVAKTSIWTIIGEIFRFIGTVVTTIWRLAKSTFQMIANIDSMELNKIMGAVLFAGVIAMGAGFIAGKLVHHEEVTEFAFAPDIDAGPVTIAQEEEPEIDIATLLQTADPEAGQGLIRACAACHTFDQGGADRVGPHMWGVVGRAKGAVEGFNYSSAMQEVGGDWTFENLNGFLQRPRDYLPGTSMSYAGMRDAGDRADLIAYLRTLDENPIPLPDPPAAPEPEADAASEDAAAVGDGDAAAVDAMDDTMSDDAEAMDAPASEGEASDATETTP